MVQNSRPTKMLLELETLVLLKSKSALAGVYIFQNNTPLLEGGGEDNF